MQIKPKKEQPEILKLFDAADYLGVSARTVRRMVKEEAVEYFKTVRGHYRFEKAALEKYKQESKIRVHKNYDEPEEDKGISITKQ